MLQTTISKLLSLIAVEMLRPVIALMSGDRQYGFVPGRMGIEAVHRVRDWYSTTGGAIAFIDIKSAYDDVPREALVGFLQKWNCQPEFIAFCRTLLTPNRVYTLYKGEISNRCFTSKLGVKQGDPVSPFFF
jgi:hypothetical protein